MKVWDLLFETVQFSFKENIVRWSTSIRTKMDREFMFLGAGKVLLWDRKAQRWSFCERIEILAVQIKEKENFLKE